MGGGSSPLPSPLSSGGQAGTCGEGDYHRDERAGDGRSLPAGEREGNRTKACPNPPRPVSEPRPNTSNQTDSRLPHPARLQPPSCKSRGAIRGKKTDGSRGLKTALSLLLKRRHVRSSVLEYIRKPGIQEVFSFKQPVRCHDLSRSWTPGFLIVLGTVWSMQFLGLS